MVSWLQLISSWQLKCFYVIGSLIQQKKTHQNLPTEKNVLILFSISKGLFGSKNFPNYRQYIIYSDIAFNYLPKWKEYVTTPLLFFSTHRFCSGMCFDELFVLFDSKGANFRVVHLFSNLSRHNCFCIILNLHLRI